MVGNVCNGKWKWAKVQTLDSLSLLDFWLSFEPPRVSFPKILPDAFLTMDCSHSEATSRLHASVSSTVPSVGDRVPAQATKKGCRVSFLEIFKTCLDTILDTLLYVCPCWSRSWSKRPFLLGPFCNSVIRLCTLLSSHLLLGIPWGMKHRTSGSRCKNASCTITDSSLSC